MSAAFKPATAELKSVLGSPETKSDTDKFTISSCITPSIIQIGLVSPKIEEEPLIVILGAAPKVPVTFCTLTPAALPSKALDTSATPSNLISSALMV